MFIVKIRMLINPAYIVLYISYYCKYVQIVQFDIFHYQNIRTNNHESSIAYVTVLKTIRILIRKAIFNRMESVIDLPLI